VQNIRHAGLEPNVVRQPNGDPTFPETFVFKQQPQPGSRENKGGSVTIYVSTGPPKTEVPDVVGKSSDDAIAALTDAKLRANAVTVPSDKPTGTVLAQDPPPGKKVVEETKVRINVSSGPKPIGVPNVVGVAFDSANGELQGLGFKVTRVDVDSSQAKNTVVSQDPAAGTFQPKGTPITLNVSKGPKTSTIPDVTSEDQATATATLQGSQFRVRVHYQDTTDPNQDGTVLSQDPAGNTQAKPGTTVTITVGRIVSDTTTTTP
jgi:serine/threonine-protein kinase